MQKTCAQCRQSFEIADDDIRFYEKVSPEFGGRKYAVPPPTLCYRCRQQRRLTWRNEKRLYHRKCDLTGKQILSIYSPDKPYKVFEHHDWYSDAWDPMSFGREFDFSKPFFAQFDALHHACPLRSFNLQEESVNADYTNLANRNKNCYLIFAATGNEDCHYSTYVQRNKNIVDCFFTFECELCYECIDCYNSYNLAHSQQCHNCRDSWFLFDCKGCSDCFGCVSVANKSHHLFNQPLSKGEYEKSVAAIRSDPALLAKAKEEFNRLKLAMPHKNYAGLSNENVTGDHISYSRNAQYCFDCTYIEDCKFCTWLHQSKDCWDVYAWGLLNCELGYENHLCGNAFHRVLFCESCWNNISDLYYCRYCMDGCHHCFGCVCLRHKEYCILNKQYTKDEYERLVPRIIDHMRKTGEWGEFFPSRISPYGYNETVAQEYFPLSKEEALSCGWKWHETEEQQSAYMGPPVTVPDSIADTPDDICSKILLCEATKKPYKIIPQELKFYRMMNVPVPRKCFDERHRERIALRNPRKLWDRQCAKCKKDIQTTYAPDRPEIVYCEKCYLQTVY